MWVFKRYKGWGSTAFVANVILVYVLAPKAKPRDESVHWLSEVVSSWFCGAVEAPEGLRATGTHARCAKLHPRHKPT